MAEVLSKANLPSYCNQNQQKNNVSVIPKSCTGSCSMRGSFPSVKLEAQAFRLFSSPSNDFHDNRSMSANSPKSSIYVQNGLRIGNAQRWWEKGLQPNMKEVTSAQELVDALLNAGDKLVVVDFFSPGCGGCKALHPKICQLAEVNPDVQFLQVNYEEHKSLCYSLNVHVLPFFRFYRGAHGRLCSFSCTNATIKKFKEALAKHTTERCSLGPTKGLEEKELLALAANKDLSFNYAPNPQPMPVPTQEEMALPEVSPSQEEIATNFPLPLPSTFKSAQETEDKTLVSAGR